MAVAAAVAVAGPMVVDGLDFVFVAKMNLTNWMEYRYRWSMHGRANVRASSKQNSTLINEDWFDSVDSDELIDVPVYIDCLAPIVFELVPLDDVLAPVHVVAVFVIVVVNVAVIDVAVEENLAMVEYWKYLP